MLYIFGNRKQWGMWYWSQNDKRPGFFTRWSLTASQQVPTARREEIKTVLETGTLALHLLFQEYCKIFYVKNSCSIFAICQMTSSDSACLHVKRESKWAIEPHLVWLWSCRHLLCSALKLKLKTRNWNTDSLSASLSLLF